MSERGSYRSVPQALINGPDFQRLPELVDADASLVRRGRFLTVTFLVEVGATAYLIHVVPVHRLLSVV